MSFGYNRFYQHETFKEVIQVIGEKIEPRDMREKQDQYLILGVVLRGADRVKEFKKDLQRRFQRLMLNTELEHLNES